MVGNHLANICKVFFESFIVYCLSSIHVAEYKKQRLQVKVLSFFADLLRKIVSKLFRIFNCLLGIKILLAICLDLLKFNRTVQREGYILKNIVLIEVSSVPFLVLEHHSLIVFCLAVDETYVKEPGNHNKQNKECN